MSTEANTDGIIYVPQSDTYRIRVGKRVAEISAKSLKHLYNIDQIESILFNGNNALKNYLLDTILNSGGKLIDDLYKGPTDPANTVVACIDLPEMKSYYDPNDVPKVYYNDRFPSVSESTIIDEAIKLLNTKKNLHATKLSLNKIFNGFMLLIHSDVPFIQGSDKTLTAVIKQDAFDRAHKTTIDNYAGLNAKLDTDTYIKLRIAFLLYETVKKINEYNKEKMNSDIFEVISCNIK